MNQYETVFILTPVLSDVQMKEAVDVSLVTLRNERIKIIQSTILFVNIHIIRNIILVVLSRKDTMQGAEWYRRRASK